MKTMNEKISSFDMYVTYVFIGYSNLDARKTYFVESNKVVVIAFSRILESLQF